MGSLRFLLILMLTVVMDLGSPVVPEASEAFEEFEEAAHGRRRILRLAHVASPGSGPTVVTTAALQASRRAVRRPPARPVAAPRPKVPPLVPDPASAVDDH